MIALRKVSCGYKGGIDAAINRGLIYAPYADLIWCETSEPDIDEAASSPRRFTRNSPASCWLTTAHPLSTGSASWMTRRIAEFQKELAAMGYKFQFVTLAGFHALTSSMFELARHYAKDGMAAYSRLQEKEFESLKTMATRRFAISASWAPDTLTKWPRPSPMVSLPPWRWKVPRKTSSSRLKKQSKLSLTADHPSCSGAGGILFFVPREARDPYSASVASLQTAGRPGSWPASSCTCDARFGAQVGLTPDKS